MKTKASQIIAGSEKSVPPPSVPGPCGMVWSVAGLMTETLSPTSDETTIGATRFQWYGARSTL